MHKQFPHGFTCAGCYLNARQHLGRPTQSTCSRHRSIPASWRRPEAIEQITGLHINYYVLIDLKGFQRPGRRRWRHHDRRPPGSPIGGVGADHRLDQPRVQTLDGYQTLWYARSRATTDDYSRMARQKCVMNAMLHQLDPDHGADELRRDRQGR